MSSGIDVKSGLEEIEAQLKHFIVERNCEDELINGAYKTVVDLLDDMDPCPLETPGEKLYEYSLKLSTEIDERQPLEAIGYKCEQEMHTGAICIWPQDSVANETTIWCTPFWEGMRAVSIQPESEFGSPKSVDIPLEPTFIVEQDIAAWKEIMVKWLLENK